MEKIWLLKRLIKNYMVEQNIKAVIFDVDGVLINSKDAFGKYLWDKNIEKDLGLSLDQKRYLFSSDWSLVLKGLIDTRQYFKNRFTALNIGLPVDTFIEYWLEHDLSINTEILPVIESIKVAKLYTGTNQDSYRMALLQKKFAKYFDGMFASHHMGFVKPEPEYFKYIEANLNMQAQDIAFIDDSLSHVQAATQLGWTCHHYQNIEACKNFIRILLPPTD